MTIKEKFFIVSIFAAAAFVCYGGTLNAGFVWDDQFLVLENPLLRAPLYSFRIFIQDITNSNFSYTIYYRPIQILSYAIDYRIWGFSSYGFHLTSIIIHAVNGLLFFIFVRKIAESVSLAFLSAFLFIIHPVNSAAVSYISSRTDLLFFFFSMLFLLFFLSARQSGNPLYMGLSALSFALALMSKETAVILPFLAFLTDITLTRHKEKSGWRYYAPGLAVLICYIFLHICFFGERYHVLFVKDNLFSLAGKYMNILREYLCLMFLPLDIGVRRALEGSGVTNHLIFVFACLLILIFYIFCKDKRRLLTFSVMFFMISIFPMVFVMDYFKVIGEHWLYLAGTGLVLAPALVLVFLYERSQKVFKVSLFLGFFLLVFFLLVFFYSSSTIGQNKYWMDNLSLSQRVLGLYKDDKIAMHYKALEFLNRGYTDFSRDVMADYIKYGKDDPKAWYIKGRMALAGGNKLEAAASFRESIRLDPSYDNGYFGLGLSSFADGKTQNGIKLLEHAVKLNPHNIEALIILGTAYSEAGYSDKSLQVSKSAKKIDPYNYNVIVNLGTSYLRSGDVQSGANEYLEAIRFYPEKALAYYNLAYIFSESEDVEMALEYVNKCLDLDPSFKPAIELYSELRKR